MTDECIEDEEQMTEEWIEQEIEMTDECIEDEDQMTEEFIEARSKADEWIEK